MAFALQTGVNFGDVVEFGQVGDVVEFVE